MQRANVTMLDCRIPLPGFDARENSKNLKGTVIFWTRRSKHETSVVPRTLPARKDCPLDHVARFPRVLQLDDGGVFRCPK